MKYKFRKYILAFLLSFITVFIFSLLTDISIKKSDILVRILNKESIYIPDYRLNKQHEIVLTYVGSSTCVWSNKKKLPSKIDSLKKLVMKQAEINNIGFNTIGIAKDWNINQGINYLKRFGYFDEIIVGNNWHNLGISKYIYGDKITGTAETPQVILTKRTYKESSIVGIGNNNVTNEIKNEIELFRKIGLKEINQWIKEDAEIPTNVYDKLEQEQY